MKRRNVLRVGAAYAVVAWLIIQVAETIFPLFGFDDTPARIVVIVLAVGFLPALVLAWAFEWTPEGLRREVEFDPARPPPPPAGKRLDRLIMVGLALALGWFAFDRFVLVPRQAATLVEEAREAGRTEALVESYGDRSIAVLPFRDMSPEGDQEYLSDGLAEELLNVLAAVPDLRVISRTSSFAFKGQALGTPEIAQRLKVGHVLEGSVRKSGNQVRITAQLIEARSDTHLWSRTWDRDLSDVFALQDEIAGAVAESLSSVLLEPGESAPAEQMTSNELEAYEIVLRGRFLMNQQTGEAYARAVPLFEQAIALAPDMAAAHGALAKALRQSLDFGQAREEEVIPRIEAALEHAFELDPGNVDALVTKGKMLWGPDTERAREYWRRAAELNPSEPDAWRYLAFSYQQTDSLKYLELLRKTYNVDPTRWLTNYQLMQALSEFGHYDEALRNARDYHAIAPDSIDPMLWYADVHFFREQFLEAIKGYYAVFRSDPEPVMFSAIPWVMIDLEQYDLALSWARELEARLPGSTYSLAPMVFALSFQGKTGEARQALEAFTSRVSYAEGFGEPEGLYTLQSFLLRQENDYAGVLIALERGLTPPGETEPRINPNNFRMDWLAWANYTWALEASGETERARELVAELVAMLEAQRENGAIRMNLVSTGFLLSLFTAKQGDKARALYWLEQAIDDEARLCTGCLRRRPEFDGLRGDPRFEALVNRVSEDYAAQRQQLADAGLLLTPEEVRALDDFDFDPFANQTSR